MPKQHSAVTFATIIQCSSRTKLASVDESSLAAGVLRLNPEVLLCIINILPEPLPYVLHTY